MWFSFLLLLGFFFVYSLDLARQRSRKGLWNTFIVDAHLSPFSVSFRATQPCQISDMVQLLPQSCSLKLHTFFRFSRVFLEKCTFLRCIECDAKLFRGIFDRKIRWFIKNCCCRGFLFGALRQKVTYCHNLKYFYNFEIFCHGLKYNFLTIFT